MTVIDLETRTCVRCGFTLPLSDFARSPNGYGHARTCDECQPYDRVVHRVTALAVDMMLRVVAAGALLYLGLTVAAALVLDYREPHRWPTIPAARRMQRRHP